MKDSSDSAKSAKIVVSEGGPYEVSGGVPLAIQVITPNAEGFSWDWVQGRTFEVNGTYKLCRCGRSKNKPFCDDSHIAARFKGTETASRAPYARQAETYDGPALTLSDAENLCAFARFCDPAGKIWSLIDETADPDGRGRWSFGRPTIVPRAGWSCTTSARTRRSSSRCLRRSASSRTRRLDAAVRCGCAAGFESSPRTGRRTSGAIA